MLAILTTHPIQYQVPLWQMLAEDGRVPFEVWYLSEHATRLSRDREFKQEFAWDINMLTGYSHRFLKTPATATPNTPFRMRITESLPKLFRETNTKILWVNGWQVASYWQAIWAAQRAGIQVWMRGESNSMARRAVWKQRAKSIVLSELFKRVDQFLCIGTANRELYRSYGVPESKLHMAMYAVDNARFARQARELKASRKELRGQWGIPQDAFCVLFCGKFIPKKHPMDLIKAAQLLLSQRAKGEAQREALPLVHLLFAGSGELGSELRANCHVAYDADQPLITDYGPQTTRPDNREPITDNAKPRASFTGFLNQTEVSRAYVAADCLVLPSDYDETWGLVVNEAMASGLPCIISDRCGCAPDLGGYRGNSVFPFGHIPELADQAVRISANKRPVPEPPSLQETVGVAAVLYDKSSTR